MTRDRELWRSDDCHFTLFSAGLNQRSREMMHWVMIHTGAGAMFTKASAMGLPCLSVRSAKLMVPSDLTFSWAVCFFAHGLSKLHRSWGLSRAV